MFIKYIFELRICELKKAKPQFFISKRLIHKMPPKINLEYATTLFLGLGYGILISLIDLF